MCQDREIRQELSYAFLDNYDEHDPVNDIPEVTIPCNFALFKTKQAGLEIIPETWKGCHPKIAIEPELKHCGTLDRSQVLPK